jgi:hypothetical protein
VRIVTWFLLYIWQSVVWECILQRFSGILSMRMGHKSALVYTMVFYMIAINISYLKMVYCANILVMQILNPFVMRRYKYVYALHTLQNSPFWYVACKCRYSNAEHRSKEKVSVNERNRTHMFSSYVYRQYSLWRIRSLYSCLPRVHNGNYTL